MTMIFKNFLQKFLAAYEFSDLREFLLSLCPSFKYDLQVPSFSIGAVLAVLSEYLGFGPVIVVAMTVAVIVETISGVIASKKLGVPFESHRFSRCVIKVFIWLTLVYLANSFSLECASRSGWLNQIGVVFFDIIRLLVLAYFVVEYVVSILENLAVIDGKPKTQFIEGVQSIWKSFLGVIKSIFKKDKEE